MIRITAVAWDATRSPYNAVLERWPRETMDEVRYGDGQEETDKTTADGLP